MGNMTQLLGSNPLTQSLMNRGIDLATLAQQTPSSASFQPDMQYPPQMPLPNKSPMAGIQGAMNQPQNLGIGTNMPPTAAPQATGSTIQPTPVPTPTQNLNVGTNNPVTLNPNMNEEAMAIVKVLGDRLAHHNKMEAKSAR